MEPAADTTTYTVEELSAMSFRELQALAKTHGIRANQSAETLRSELEAALSCSTAPAEQSVAMDASPEEAAQPSNTSVAVTCEDTKEVEAPAEELTTAPASGDITPDETACDNGSTLVEAMESLSILPASAVKSKTPARGCGLTEEALSHMKYNELRSLAKTMNTPAKGKQADLVQAILAAQKEADASAPALVEIAETVMPATPLQQITEEGTPVVTSTDVTTTSSAHASEETVPITPGYSSPETETPYTESRLQDESMASETGVDESQVGEAVPITPGYSSSETQTPYTESRLQDESMVSDSGLVDESMVTESGLEESTFNGESRLDASTSMVSDECDEEEDWVEEESEVDNTPAESTTSTSTPGSGIQLSPVPMILDSVRKEDVPEKETAAASVGEMAALDLLVKETPYMDWLPGRHRVKCGLTGHELVPRLAEVHAYVFTTKRRKRVQARQAYEEESRQSMKQQENVINNKYKLKGVPTPQGTKTVFPDTPETPGSAMKPARQQQWASSSKKTPLANTRL